MINTRDILETIKMIEEEHLDIRTITMGISLRDLASDDIHVLCDKIYDKITRRAEKLVATGESMPLESSETTRPELPTGRPPTPALLRA